MEFRDVVRRRRMVRNYDPDRPVPTEVRDRILEHAIRAPSAGFSQGWSFLVLEDEEGITVVDQHALHERVLYDRIRARFRSGETTTQRLLRPVVVELSPVEAGRLLDEREALAAAGLIVEPFGDTGVSVVGLPTGVPGSPADR